MVYRFEADGARRRRRKWAVLDGGRRGNDHLEAKSAQASTSTQMAVGVGSG